MRKFFIIDKESLPQINLGILNDGESGLPLAYQIYPGSIVDVSTLNNIVRLADSIGITKDTQEQEAPIAFVLDKGFYSRKNLEMMLEKGVDFLVPLTFTTTLAKQILADCAASVTSPSNGFVYNDNTYFYQQHRIQLGKHSVVANIFHDERRKADKLNALMHKLCELEEKTAAMQFDSEEELADFVSEVSSNTSLISLYHISKPTTDIPYWHLRRNDSAIEESILKMGKMILLSSTSYTNPREILSLYRSKDRVEKVFDSMKNELQHNRLRVHSDAAMKGKVFVMFLALILYTYLLRALEDSKIKDSVPQILATMRTLKVLHLADGTAILSEFSKKHRSILALFGLSPHEAPRY